MLRYLWARHISLTFCVDMDVVFALAYKEGVSPVAVSLRKDVPEAGTPEADEILGITSDGPSRSKEDEGKGS